MHLRTYSTTQADYDLLATHFWDVLTPAERLKFEDVIHLLPTCDAVLEFNCCHLANTGQPVVHCKAKHNQTEAKKASDDDADGLMKEVLLAEGAKVMLTRNLWTSKGKVADIILTNNVLKCLRSCKWCSGHCQKDLVSSRLKSTQSPPSSGLC